MSNIIDPMRRVHLHGFENQEGVLSVQTVSGNFYDRLLTKDPSTIYVLTDTGEMYKGDRRIYPVQRMHPNQRYLYIRNVDGQKEFVIVQDSFGGMIEICSYLDPQDAIDFLNRDTTSPEVPEVVKSIELLIRNHRDISIKNHTGAKATMTIIAIMKTVFTAGNETSIVEDVLALLDKYPRSENPVLVPKHSKEYEELYRSFAYNVYSYVYNFFEYNLIETESFDSKELEDKWIRKMATELYKGMITKFTAR